MSDKEQRFKAVEENLVKQGFKIKDQDLERPWGGFFVIEEDQVKEFIQAYFDDVDINEINISGRLSPKILLVEPGKRLSWQYHHRREEIWQIIDGPVGVIKSISDKQKPIKEYKKGEQVLLKQGERHRLVGLENWGVVAEIWQHVYSDHLSNEKDIVRLEDDFGR
jgi:mannose-6-phosphate isomerase-like protein (cupin superfamily)